MHNICSANKSNSFLDFSNISNNEKATYVFATVAIVGALGACLAAYFLPGGHAVTHAITYAGCGISTASSLVALRSLGKTITEHKLKLGNLPQTERDAIIDSNPELFANELLRMHPNNLLKINDERVKKINLFIDAKIMNIPFEDGDQDEIETAIAKKFPRQANDGYGSNEIALKAAMKPLGLSIASERN